MQSTTSLARDDLSAGRVFRQIRLNNGRRPLNGAKVYQKFSIFTPLLWGFGILTLSAAVMTLRLLWERWPRGKAINLVVICWLGIAAVQIVTATLHSLVLGIFFQELPHLTSFAVIGWIFGALIIAMGSAHRFATEGTVRATAYLGIYMLLLELLCPPLRAMGFVPAGLQSTPLGLLLPDSSAARFYTSVVLFMREDTFGEQMSRLMLFFPWYTALGLGAVSITLISTLERNSRRRYLSMLGGTIATVFSWSRIAILCLLVSGSILIFNRLPRLVKVLCICIGVCIGYAALVNGFNPLEEYQAAQHDVDAARPGSNMARDLIYQKSWAGFVSSPWLGNGLDFPRALKTEPIAIGSHSTTYGLLYTAGAPGLAAFILAMLVTAGCMLWRLFQAPPGSMERRVLEVGLLLVLCLALYCPFEALYSLTLPCIVLFSWLGACLPSPPLPLTSGADQQFRSSSEAKQVSYSGFG